MTDSEEDTSFARFHSIITAYRLGRLMMVLGTSGICGYLRKGAASAVELAEYCGWDRVYTDRFLSCCVHQGFLYYKNGFYALSGFSQTFLTPGSSAYQGASLCFEETLQKSWSVLDEVLKTGARTYQEKSSKEYNADLDLFLQAMDEAAVIRSQELWDILPCTEEGHLLELGAGSGAYIKTFLKKNPLWKATFCDLPDVVARFKETIDFPCATISLNYLEGLDPLPKNECDIVLLSNVLHCQSRAESKRLIQQCRGLLRKGGRLVLHDFFTGMNARSSLYDIHMMVNTYNGECMSVDEIASFLPGIEVVQLSSESGVVIFLESSE